MLRTATRHLHQQLPQKVAVSPQIAKGSAVKILAAEKRIGQLDPKNIQPIVTNKKVTIAGSSTKTSIERIMITLIKDVQIA